MVLGAMPYSDNLYSMLDEDSDIEPIGEPADSQQNYGTGVAPDNTGLHTHDDVDVYADAAAVGSGDDVDAEDPQLLSPTDGYFGTASDPSPGTVVPASSNVPHVPNVMVEDPSLQRTTADSKAREADQERLGHERSIQPADEGQTSAYPSHTAPHMQNGPPSTYDVPPAQHSTASGSQSGRATYYSPSSSTFPRSVATPSSYTTYSTPSSAYHHERFPFLPNEAPPAYTPSPTSPSHPPGLGHSRNYSTFSQNSDVALNMGHPEETQALLGPQPQSMRDHSDADDAASPTWGSRLKRVGRQRFSWDKSCKLLLVAVLLFLTTGFLGSLFTSTRGNNGRHNPAGDRPKTQPGEPNMSYPDIDGDFSWDANSFCKDAQIHQHFQDYDVSFSSQKPLVLSERSDDDEGRRGWGQVHVQGAVIFRRSAPEKTPKSSITVAITVTDERLKVYSSWDGEQGKLNLVVPRRVEWTQQDQRRACVHLKVTAWVPEGAELARLNVTSEHLDIKLLDNLSLSVAAEGTKLVSTVGTITSAASGTAARDAELVNLEPPHSFRFHSRIIDVRSTSGSIKGSWPLYDFLGLRSTSGDVRAGVVPHAEDPDAPKPAILSVKTSSGNAEVRVPIIAAEHTLRVGEALPAEADRARAVVRTAEILPPRDYRVDVHTTSGDVTAAAPFSSAALFRTTSGDISLDLLPVLDVSLADSIGGGDGEGGGVRLDTGSTSGETDVRVLEPLWVGGEDSKDSSSSSSSPASGRDDGVGAGVKGNTSAGWRKPSYIMMKAVSAAMQDGYGDGSSALLSNPLLRVLYGTHSTTSSTIRLRYPPSWEGDISLTSLTGVLQVGGDGVKLIKARSDWPGVNKNILARKGEEGKGARVTAKTTSGDVSVWVGEK